MQAAVPAGDEQTGRQMARNSGPKLTKAELQAEADAALAAFRNKGGAIQQMPAAEAVSFACSVCGHTGTISAREGQHIRCPKCRAMIR